MLDQVIDLLGFLAILVAALIAMGVWGYVYFFFFASVGAMFGWVAARF